MFRPLPKLVRALGKLFLLVLIVVLPAIAPPVASAAETPKKVLIFYGNDQNLPNVALTSQMLRSTVEKGVTGRVQFYSEGLDNFRLPGARFESELVKLLQRKYEGEKFDLIFTLNSPAVKFLVKHKDELFLDTPIVFLHTNNHEVDGLDMGPNVTGVQGKIEMGPGLDLALSLHPGTQRVVVVTGNSATERFWEGLAHQQFQSFENRVQFTYLTNTTMEDLRKDLADLPPHTIVFFIAFMLDRAGNAYSLPESVALAAPSSSAPVYVPIQSGVWQGVVGGRMISYEALAKAGAELGLRILAGESPKNIPQQTVPGVAMFNWKELRRWGIAENNLPAGSLVRDREFSAWELYKWRIIGALALIVLQALGIAWLLFTRAKRRQAEASLRENEAHLLERRQELSEAQRVAKVGSWEWDPTTDAVTWSEEMFRIVGRDSSLPAPSYQEHPSVYAPASWERLKCSVDQALRDGTPYELELEMIRDDGKLVWINARGETLRDADGKIIKLRGTIQDIGERKKAELALNTALEQVSKFKNKLEEENVYLREEIKLSGNFDEIVGRSDATKYVLFKIEKVAATDSTVLVTGETGTGKELVARAIHSLSLRKDRPLVRINCAALSPTLIESELFGHEKGAFTGATGRKIGRFELANGATIFLDEIGELPLELQSKLLRVIQEGEFERLGSSKTIKVDARIIAATNRNLKTAVEQGIFREDLWYRLNVFPITVPPLRDRREDIPGLVEHFVKRFSLKIGRTISSIPPASLRVLQDYAWPGNVRELANVLERAVINTNGTVLRIVDHFDKADATQSDRTLEEIEKEYILRILHTTGWRINGHKGAAKILGLNPSTLRTRIAKLGIQKVEGKTMAQSPD